MIQTRRNYKKLFQGTWVQYAKKRSVVYVEDITQWREDIDFIFEW